MVSSLDIDLKELASLRASPSAASAQAIRTLEEPKEELRSAVKSKTSPERGAPSGRGGGHGASSAAPRGRRWSQSWSWTTRDLAVGSDEVQIRTYMATVPSSGGSGRVAKARRASASVARFMRATRSFGDDARARIGERHIGHGAASSPSSKSSLSPPPPPRRPKQEAIHASTHDACTNPALDSHTPQGILQTAGENAPCSALGAIESESGAKQRTHSAASSGSRDARFGAASHVA